MGALASGGGVSRFFAARAVGLIGWDFYPDPRLKGPVTGGLVHPHRHTPPSPTRGHGFSGDFILHRKTGIVPQFVCTA